MYVFKYVCMYVCMYLSIYLSIYLFQYVCMYVCMYEGLSESSKPHAERKDIDEHVFFFGNSLFEKLEKTIKS